MADTVLIDSLTNCFSLFMTLSCLIMASVQQLPSISHTLANTTEPRISHVIFIFCTLDVQNMKITWEIPGHTTYFRLCDTET